MSHGTSDVSIVIATRNRAKRLKRCLDAIATAAKTAACEVLVVDNGSDDETPNVIETFAKQVRFPVWKFHEQEPGSGRAKNAAWPNARGEIIAFTDDDCLVASDYVTRVAQVFADSAIGWGGGKVTLSDPKDLPMTIQLLDERIIVPPKSFVPTGLIHGANMVFRRDVLEAIGGFDPRLGAGAPFSGDDADAEARASFAGYTGVYDPSIVVAHDHGRRGTRDQRRLRRRYGLGRGAYYAKFLLNAETRDAFARGIYWEYRRKLRHGMWSSIDALQEVEGAMRRLLHG